MRIELRSDGAGAGDGAEGYVAEVYRPEWDGAAKTYRPRFVGYGIARESGCTQDGTAFAVVDAASRAEADRVIKRLPDGLCERYWPLIEGDAP